VTDALAAIRAEKAFLKLALADRERLLAVLFEAQRHIKLEQGYDRYGDRDLRISHRNALKTHLAPILRVLKHPVGGFDAMDWLTDHHRGDFPAAMAELRAFETTAQRLLEGAMAFDPDPGRTGRGELQLRTDLTRRAFFELIEALESVGLPVRVSLGPGTRLLTRLVAYAVGFEVSVNTVKALVLQRNAK
jgi:hypothetical protein